MRKHRLLALLVGFLLTLGLSTLVAPGASAAGQGTLICNQGRVQGVYVHRTGGPGYSGWARISPSGNVSDTVNWSFGGIQAGTNWYIHAGCDGTPQSWRYNMYSKTHSGQSTHDFICIVGYSGSAGGTNRCVRS